ncbi:tyrosine-type recombinase/integrase [Tepidamorphus sp. 3E244]|uniref:tyrosine-type recombinase/integrase n=1 Tax=Tepidamorphus sp. 3E244 TaxID=3385498 RepID=UPI0038FCB249
MRVSVIELWDMYGDILWEEGVHKTTCEAYVHEIEKICFQKQLKKFDDYFVDVIRAEFRKRGNKNSTINRKLACVGKLLRKHHKRGQLDRLPDLTKYPERNARVRYLSPEEEAALFEVMDWQNPQYGQLCRFLVDSGARVGEAIGLKWTDVSDHQCIFWETKTNSPRTVPLTSAAMAAIESQRGTEPGGPFASVRYCNFRNAWVRAKSRVGLADDTQVVPHILRHTCASRLAQAGVDIKRIQEFLGHRTMTMTLRYAHLAPSHLDQCARALER